MQPEAIMIISETGWLDGITGKKLQRESTN